MTRILTGFLQFLNIKHSTYSSNNTKGLKRDFSHKISVSLLCIIMLNSCDSDKYDVGFFYVRPNPGYLWRDDTFWSFSVHWVPGLKHPYIPNIFSGNVVNEWVAAPGYIMNKSKSGIINLGATWTPGLYHPVFANIISSENESYWRPEPGYTWKLPSAPHDPTGPYSMAGIIYDSLRFDIKDGLVKWSPGSTYPGIPHIFASLQVDTWSAEPGYVWNPENKVEKGVIWSEDLPHESLENVVSSTSEGMWIPTPGYVWNDSVTYENRYREYTVPVSWKPGIGHSRVPCVISTTTVGRFRAIDGYSFYYEDDAWHIKAAERKTDWSKVIVGAAIATAGLSQILPEKDDDMFTREIIRPGAREVAKAGLGLIFDEFKKDPSKCDGYTIPDGIFKRPK